MGRKKKTEESLLEVVPEQESVSQQKEPQELQEKLEGQEIIPIAQESDKKPTKFEFSKILCVTAVIIFTGVAIYTIFAYYTLMRLAIETQSSVTPDASLPIAGITSILAAVLSYCLYQGALKTSLNKNNLMIDDEGIIKPILHEVIFNEDEEDETR